MLGCKLAYPTPGEILLEEFLKPLGVSAYRLATDIDVSQIRIGQIIAGKRAITVDTGTRVRYVRLKPRDARSKASTMRVCQPGPVARQRASVCGGIRKETATFGLALFGLPRGRNNVSAERAPTRRGNTSAAGCALANVVRVQVGFS